MSGATVLVNELPLPPALLDLLEAGRWKPPGDLADLRRLTGLDDVAQLAFFDVANMRSETRQLLANAEDAQLARLRGLESSRRAGAPVGAPGALDVDRAVVLAATFGDGILCLDYRGSLARPAVVVTDWSGPACRWRVLAPDVETFAALLKL